MDKRKVETIVYLGLIGFSVVGFATALGLDHYEDRQDKNIAKVLVGDAKEYDIELKDVVTFKQTTWYYDEENDQYKVEFLLQSNEQLDNENYMQKIVYSADKDSFEKFIKIENVYSGKKKLKMVKDFCENENNHIVEYWYESEGLWIKGKGKLAEEMAQDDGVKAATIVEAIKQRHNNMPSKPKTSKTKTPKDPTVR